MFSPLNIQQCQACQIDAPQVSDSELTQLMKHLPDWDVQVKNNIKQLVREFKFKNFKQALDFTNKVAEMAENENHHPSLTTEWAKVTVSWWSHSIKGLHHNDFICAAKTDHLL